MDEMHEADYQDAIENGLGYLYPKRIELPEDGNLTNITEMLDKNFSIDKDINKLSHEDIKKMKRKVLGDDDVDDFGE